MRTFFRDHWKAIVAIVLLVVLAMFTVNPGAAQPAPDLASRLRAHVAALADARARGRQAARYIGAVLAAQGYALRWRAGRDGAPASLEAVLAAPPALDGLQGGPRRAFVVGARLATTPLGNEEADDSGAAAVLELAHLLRGLQAGPACELRFVFLFEPTAADNDPAARDAGGRDFIAFAGSPADARRVRQALAAFQGGGAAPLPGLASPAWAQGVILSGGNGSRAVVTVTDTAFLRFPYFAAASPADPADALRAQPDYPAIARVLDGLARTLAALAGGQAG